MRLHIITLLATLWCATASAQDPYAPLLEEIARNSREIKLAGREYESAVAENATGLTPADPEVEFGYLWGNRDTGNRKDVSVSQQFDFPSVYGKRRQLSRNRDASAAHLNKARRLEVLLEAKQLLVELVYWNAMLRQAETRLAYAKRTMEAYSFMAERGEATAIDSNKAALNLTASEAELARTELERKGILDRLQSMNGGEPVKFDISEYPDEPLPDDFEQWFAEAERNAPALQYLRSEIEVGRGNTALAKASGLPKLSVGYQGEYVMGSNFSGVTVGVSIPLWENRNRVRHSRAQTAEAEARLDDARRDYCLNLRSLFERARMLSDIERQYARQLAGASNDALLQKALDNGLITMIEYVTEMQYQYDMQERLLATRRDLALALAQLTAYRL